MSDGVRYVIHGSTFSVTDIFVHLVQCDAYIAEVTKINQYGYFEVTILESGKKIKRHLSDCNDLIGVCVAGHIKGLKRVDEETYVLDMINDFEDVFVVRKPCEDGYEYLARVRTNDNKFTQDITKAWFTFDKAQADNFAMRLTMKELIAYDVVSVNEQIHLDEYERLV